MESKNDLEKLGITQLKKIGKKYQVPNYTKYKATKTDIDKLISEIIKYQSNNIITNNDYSSQQSTLQNLRQQYETTLKQYNDLVAKYTGTSDDYIKRISSNNPYIGKNIRFSNGAIFYVTNQGVAKLYSSMDVYNSTVGLNGCPAAGYIQLDTVWSDSYYTQGAIIPTQPPLIVGTPMVTGQSCGNEGKNVFVNTMVENPKSTYVGCYNDQTPPTVINFAPQMNSSNTSNGFRAWASSVYFDNNDFTGPWCAFDKDPNTWWHSNVVEATGNYNTSVGFISMQENTTELSRRRI
jgi:hypothetical protein